MISVDICVGIDTIAGNGVEFDVVTSVVQIASWVLGGFTGACCFVTVQGDEFLDFVDFGIHGFVLVVQQVVLAFGDGVTHDDGLDVLEVAEEVLDHGAGLGDGLERVLHDRARGLGLAQDAAHARQLAPDRVQEVHLEVPWFHDQRLVERLLRPRCLRVEQLVHHFHHVVTDVRALVSELLVARLDVC